jgi:tRNA (adenine22-N1)-methyltransferase
MADCVPPGARLVDVGSDHGQLPLLLLRERRVRACIATERRPGGPLDRLIDRHPRLAVRFGDGLAALRAEDRFDVIALGGLGTRAIIRVLERGRLRAAAARLVLQPQTEWPRLRRFLAARGYALVDERLVEERGRFCLVLAAQPGDAAPAAVAGWSADDLLVAGPLLVRDDPVSAAAFWRDQAERIERACAAQRGRRADRLLPQLQRARRILAALDCRACADSGCSRPGRLAE